MAAAIFKAMSKMEAIVSSFALQNTPTLQFTIGDKIVETLSSNGITSENKTNCTLPHPVYWGLGCFLFSTDSSNSGTTLHGGGRGGKDLFPPFKLARRQRGPLGQSVSTNFVADCREIARERKSKKYITLSSLFFRVSSSTALDQSACEKSLCYCKTWIW